MLTLFGKI